MINKDAARKMLTATLLLEEQVPHFNVQTSWKLLLVLAVKPNQGTVELQEPMGMVAQNISRIIRKLSERPGALGLIEAHPDPKAYNVPLYRLTQKGEALVEEIISSVQVKEAK